MTRDEKYECASHVLPAIQNVSDAIRAAKRCKKSAMLVRRLERAKELLLATYSGPLGAAGVP